jgi:hypothetical protein
MKETWKPVVGYEDYYEVSSLGRLRSLPKVVGGRWGKCQYKGKIIKVIRNPSHGYGQLSLVGEWKKKTVRAHRVVAEAFIPNPGNKPYVNHIDCDKLNNRIDNLEWVTAKENTAHIIKMDRFNPKRGEEVSGSKLNKDDVIEIRRSFGYGYSMTYLANAYKVSISTISDALKRNTWKHL